MSIQVISVGIRRWVFVRFCPRFKEKASRCSLSSFHCVSESGGGIILSFGLPPSLFITPSKKDPYKKAVFTQAALTQRGFEPYQDDISAFGLYSVGGLADPKIAGEAAAYRTGPGWVGYTGGFFIAASYGMFVAGALGWLFDPLDLREGSFAEDFPAGMVGLDIVNPRHISL